MSAAKNMKTFWFIAMLLSPCVIIQKPRRRDSIVLQDLQSLVFLVALEQGLAYPLGLNSAASLAAGIQILAWIPSALARNEKFYDFTGDHMEVPSIYYYPTVIFSNQEKLRPPSKWRVTRIAARTREP